MVHYVGVKRMMLVGIERILKQVTDLIVCDSKSERADVLKWKVARPDRTRVIWNGIDLERLNYKSRSRIAARQALQISDQTPLLVTVCRLNKPRDFETLLAGMTEIVHQRPDAQLLIVGDGPLRSYVQVLIEQFQLVKHVQLLGLVRDVGDVLMAADIFLLITAGWEGLPLSALEASAMKLPVIISDVGGNREAVIDGETGYVIPPRDVAAFVCAVQRALTNPARAREMGEAGAARVQKDFGLQTMAAQVAEVYRSLVT